AKSSVTNADAPAKPFKGKCYKCGMVGHTRRDCMARVVPHPSQVLAGEDDESKGSGESECLFVSHDALRSPAVKKDLVAYYEALFKCLVATNECHEAPLKRQRVVEEWFADTGAPLHMTDSLDCMKNIEPCHKSVKGVGDATCEVALKGS
ncbi:unnamed protein product, partial [Discosporangium mesarthrocarpum]